MRREDLVDDGLARVVAAAACEPTQYGRGASCVRKRSTPSARGTPPPRRGRSGGACRRGRGRPEAASAGLKTRPTTVGKRFGRRVYHFGANVPPRPATRRPFEAHCLAVRDEVQVGGHALPCRQARHDVEILVVALDEEERRGTGPGTTPLSLAISPTRQPGGRRPAPWRTPVPSRRSHRGHRRGRLGAFAISVLRFAILRQPLERKHDRRDARRSAANAQRSTLSVKCSTLDARRISSPTPAGPACPR